MSAQTDEEMEKPCIQDRLRSLIGCAGVSIFKCLVIIFSAVCFLYASGNFIIGMNLVSDFKINLITELIGIGITFLLIERWISRREETRRKPHKESLLLQISSSYYVIGTRLRDLMRSIVYASVDNDVNWIISRIPLIEIIIRDLNRSDNLAQDLLSFEFRSEVKQINSEIEVVLSMLRDYGNYPLPENQVIMDLAGVTLMIARIVDFLESHTELGDYDLDEIRVPIFSMEEARDFYNLMRDDAISSRARVANYEHSQE